MNKFVLPVLALLLAGCAPSTVQTRAEAPVPSAQTYRTTCQAAMAEVFRVALTLRTRDQDGFERRYKMADSDQTSDDLIVVGYDPSTGSTKSVSRWTCHGPMNDVTLQVSTRADSIWDVRNVNGAFFKEIFLPR